jgi:hypothetical protein
VYLWYIRAAVQNLYLHYLNAFPGQRTTQTTPKQTESNIRLLAFISTNRNKNLVFHTNISHKGSTYKGYCRVSVMRWISVKRLKKNMLAKVQETRESEEEQ